jgi:hypothetical protein
VLVLLMLASLPSCLQIPRLPHRHVSAHAEVHARSLEHARAVSAWIDSTSPRIQARLGTTRETPRVYVAPELLDRNLQGICYGTHIVVDGRAPDIEKQLVIHELVHWHCDPPWTQLSEPLWEGLADALVRELDPEGSARFLRMRLAYALASLERPDVAERTERQLGAYSPRWRRDGSRTSPWSNAVAYVLVRRIGIDRLHAICLASRSAGERVLPASRLLSAAGFERLDTAEMHAIVAELLREAEASTVIGGFVTPP